MKRKNIVLGTAGIGLAGIIAGTTLEASRTDRQEYHIVLTGETFSGIHKKHACDVDYQEFQNLNSNLRDYGNIHPGDTIWLPDRATADKKGTLRIYEKRKRNKQEIEQGAGKELGQHIIKFLNSPENEQVEELREANTFGMIALSNMAQGMAYIAKDNPSLKGQLSAYQEELVHLALHPSINPYGSRTLEEGIFDEAFHGLYLSHLNIILGSYEATAETGKYRSSNARISRLLASKTMESLDAHIRSYPDMPYHWPADQSATLYSLHLFDENFGTDLSDAPISKWLRSMKEHTDEDTGLHESEVTGKASYGDTPRGCALSWTIAYMSHYAPEEAAALWKHYKDHFFQDYGAMGGFREWPKGVSESGDADSGPIILGTGTAATALGLRAAHAMGDEKAYKKLWRTVNAGYGVIRPVGKVAGLAGKDEISDIIDHPLAHALLLTGRTQPGIGD